jgi:transposase
VHEARGGAAVIPTPKSRAERRQVDRHPYRERNVAERFRSKAEQFRRVAARYEKKAADFLAFVQAASVMVMSQ